MGFTGAGFLPFDSSSNMEIHVSKNTGNNKDSKCGVAGNLLQARKNMLNVYKYILVNMHCIYIQKSTAFAIGFYYAVYGSYLWWVCNTSIQTIHAYTDCQILIAVFDGFLWNFFRTLL